MSTAWRGRCKTPDTPTPLPPSADACVCVRTQDRKPHTQSGNVCLGGGGGGGGGESEITNERHRDCMSNISLSIHLSIIFLINQLVVWVKQW